MQEIGEGQGDLECVLGNPREARGPQRRKCSLVYKMLQIGGNYGDCKNAVGTSFSNV